MIIEVSLSLGLFDTFAYEFKGDPDEIYPGLRVVVPLWNRIATGWVIKCRSDYKGKVKPVLGVIRDDYLPGDSFLSFAEKVSETFFLSTGKILDNSLSPRRRSVKNICVKVDGKAVSIEKFTLTKFTDISKGVPVELFYKTIEEPEDPVGDKTKSLTNDNISKNKVLFLKYSRIEEYIKIWELNRPRGKSVLLILPNNLSMEKYKAAIPDINIYNSTAGIKYREDLWKAVQKEPVFIGGGELSLFLPFSNIGTIIVEKPGSFYYSRNLYSGIDIRRVAEIRSAAFNTDLVYGAPTYTASLYRNKENICVRDEREEKNIKLNVLRIKPGEKTVPGKVIDLVNMYYFEKKRVLIIINKKRSTGFLFCPECKKIERCSRCGGSIKAEGEFSAVCLKCGYKNQHLNSCEKCNTELKIVMDISAESVRSGIEARIPEKDILVLNIEDVEKDVFIYKKISEKNIVISTPAIINNLSENTFDSIIFIKPESFFDLNEHNSAELIFCTIADLKEIITKDGNIDIFSTFFFHYSLKNADNEMEFFERELKYRRYFMLPPYADIYILEIKDKDLKVLGKKMRNLYGDFREKFNISRIYLHSRAKKRGFFKGIFELHTDAEYLIESGLTKRRDVTVKRNIL